MTLSACEQLLKDSMGLDVASIGATAIERAVRHRQRACQLPDVHAYWEHLRASQAELQELIDAVVVPETWFFRDRESFAALARLVRDELLPANVGGGGPVRLLSVPCATGEEPYSIVMTLMDAGLPADRLRVDAIDICERLLIHARRGLYGRGAFRGTDLHFRARYFESAPGGYLLAESVRQQVRFQHGNLLSPDFLPGTARYDVIFCRNVLIYFDRPTQDRALAVLSRLLTDSGMLFVGPAESGVVLEHDFRSAKLPLAFAFRKAERAPAEAKPVETRPLRQGHAAHAAPASYARLVPPATARTLPQSPLQPPPLQPSRQPSLQPPTQAPSQALPQALRQSLLNASPAPAARQADRPAELEEARALADQGRFEEAAALCDVHLRKHGPTADACFLLGLVRDARGSASDAEVWYRKAIYLDQHHEQALLHLALLLERHARRTEARVLRQRLNRVVAILKAAGPGGGTQDPK
jgi:chemotaxis protein methyltransferase WspC